MEVFNLKIASEAVGVNKMAQQSKIGNEKEVSQVQNPGEQMPNEPEGGSRSQCDDVAMLSQSPSAVVWQSPMETWSGNQCPSVVPDPVRGALTHLRAVPRSELQVHETTLKVSPLLSVPFISSSSNLYCSPSSVCPG